MKVRVTVDFVCEVSYVRLLALSLNGSGMKEEAEEGEKERRNW